MSASLKKFGDVLSSKALGFAAVLVMAGGMIGNVIDDVAKLPPDNTTGDLVRLLVYDFIKALKLFSLSLPDQGIKENWIVLVARFVGSLVAMAAVFKLIATVFRQDVTRFLASFYRNHTVVLGCGTRNARFLAGPEFRAAKGPIVIVDNDPNKSKPFADLSHALFFQSDLTISGAMSPANIAKAGTILIGAGSDERNLALARSVVRARSSAEGGRIVLTIDDAALAERCARDPGISRPKNGDDLAIFNMATLTARSLLARMPFSDLALSSGQDRVQLIFVGLSEAAQEIILQFLRVSACHGLGRPRIDIIAQDRKAAMNQILERAPNLGYALYDPTRAVAENEPLSWAAEIRIHSGEGAALCYDEALVKAITAQSDPTAFVVATSDNVQRHKFCLRQSRCLPHYSLRSKTSFAFELFSLYPTTLHPSRTGALPCKLNWSAPLS